MMVWAKYGAPRWTPLWFAWRGLAIIRRLACLVLGHDRVNATRHFFNPSYMEYGHACRRCEWFVVTAEEHRL